MATAPLRMPPLRLRLNWAGVAWLVFYALVLAAWGVLFAMIRANPAAGTGDMPAAFWASLCLAADAASLPALLAMWGLMSAAMMLPTFVPALRTFRQMSATGATSLGGAAALVAGYLGVWLAASGAGALAQLGLARAGLLAPDGQSISGVLSAGLLFLAGAYQFSLFKAACLAKCRMPLTFFMERWQPGAVRALRMGAELGWLCLGCCWALMLLGFVGGTMNLLWMGAATLFMVLEKLPDIGRKLTRPAGWALILAGGATLLRTIGFF
jgi:predicted metal-binding membrane protein